MNKNLTAGIVCYTVHDGVLHFLLGREQFVSGWLCSHQWSEPGGHAKKVDEGDIAKTALREFHEESLGLLGHITPLIEEKKYAYALEIFRRRKRSKTFFLLQQAYSPTIQTEFHVRREQLRGIQYTLHRLQTIQKQLLQLNTPTPEHPRRVHDRLQVILDILGLQEMDDHTFRVHVSSICPTDRVYFRYPRPTDEFIISESYLEAPEAAAPVYTRLLSLRQLLAKQLVALPPFLREHAIAYPKLPVWLPHVRREFMEKDRLEWVPAVDILRRENDGWCRPGFVLPCQLMVAQLTRPKIPLMLEKNVSATNCYHSVPETSTTAAGADPHAATTSF